VLFVALNSDLSVRENKGPLRPVVPEGERAELLSHLDCVDWIVMFDEPTAMGAWSHHLTFWGVARTRSMRFAGSAVNHARCSFPAGSPWSWGNARALCAFRCALGDTRRQFAGQGVALGMFDRLHG
jgi:hypothetical protein